MRILLRLLTTGLNFMILLSYISLVSKYSNDFFMIILILNYLAAINIHYTKDFLLLSFESSFLIKFMKIIPPELYRLALVGVIVNIIIIKNNLISNLL